MYVSFAVPLRRRLPPGLSCNFDRNSPESVTDDRVRDPLMKRRNDFLMWESKNIRNLEEALVLTFWHDFAFQSRGSALSIRGLFEAT